MKTIQANNVHFDLYSIINLNLLCINRKTDSFFTIHMTFKCPNLQIDRRDIFTRIQSILKTFI